MADTQNVAGHARTRGDFRLKSIFTAVLLLVFMSVQIVHVAIHASEHRCVSVNLVSNGLRAHFSVAAEPESRETCQLCLMMQGFDFVGSDSLSVTPAPHDLTSHLDPVGVTISARPQSLVVRGPPSLLLS